MRVLLHITRYSIYVRELNSDGTRTAASEFQNRVRFEERVLTALPPPASVFLGLVRIHRRVCGFVWMAFVIFSPGGGVHVVRLADFCIRGKRVEFFLCLIGTIFFFA